MLKTRLTKGQITALTQQLQSTLEATKDDLKIFVKTATNDTLSDFDHDYQVITDILKSLPKTDFNTTYASRKPKGKILIMLSYNEPLVMCIDPIASALIAGNEVYVRPSSASSHVLHALWDAAFTTLPWLSDRLTIIDTDHHTTLDHIALVQAVYFFGSQRVAEKIGAECSKRLIEFWPETEGSDFAIYSDSASLSIEEFTEYVYGEAFSHSGQMCQRLQGVFVHRSKYEPLKEALQSIISTAALSDFNTPNAQQIKMRETYDQLVTSHFASSYLPGKQANMPSLITNIPPSSSVCQNAFFLPTLWLIPYDYDELLVNEIAMRPVQFGVNIWTAGRELVKAIAERTRLTRITVNTRHIDIRHDEGWGGSQPTSFGGSMRWSDKFSNKYNIIDK
jgi:acyl-CoA reductase-like NAD-dependent aldehyde dehydrogenase